MRGDPRPAQRQVGMVDARGNAASWTGDSCFDWAGGRAGGPMVGGKGQVIVGRTYAAQANIMVSDQTVKNMAAAFERATGSLADRLLAALVAGQAGGGDKRGMESAALLVVRKNAGYLGSNDRYIDIRVYDDTNPDRKSTRLNSSHSQISYAVFCLKKKKNTFNQIICHSSLSLYSTHPFRSVTRR